MIMPFLIEKSQVSGLPQRVGLLDFKIIFELMALSLLNSTHCIHHSKNPYFKTYASICPDVFRHACLCGQFTAMPVGTEAYRH
jgi:hypothetical protein